MPVVKPTNDQIRQALEAAERMHMRDLDPHHLAVTVRYLANRNEILEQLAIQVDRVLRFGLAEQEMTKLRRMIGQLRDQDEAAEQGKGDDKQMFL